MGYEARIERYSTYPDCKNPLISFVITAPRVVLAELVTHRRDSDTWGDFEISWCERTTDKTISKNSASSRAIPFKIMLETIKEDPYMPSWTLNQSGMQGATLTDEAKKKEADYEWLEALKEMSNRASRLEGLGIHKQDCNRLLEPWAWVTQIVTSSHWDNFFALRCHKAAHPAFRTIARKMFLLKKKATPQILSYGQWHLPFVPIKDQMAFRWVPVRGRELPDLIKFSAARCAWVSYNNHDKESNQEAMLKTWNRLFSEIPVHASPVEHQATVLGTNHAKTEPELISNLTGWLQARKLIQHEEIKEYDPSDEEIASWGDLQ